MVHSEPWAYGHVQICIFAGTQALAAHNAMMQMILLFTAVNFGILMATSVRVGHVLGTPYPKHGWSVFRMSVSLSAAFSLCVGAVLVLAREDLGRIFTSDPEIVHLCSEVHVDPQKANTFVA